MVIKSNFPIRNIAKMNNTRVSTEEFERICGNTINKYYRSFRRLSYHFSELEIMSYPYEQDNSMHICVPESFSMDRDDYVHQVYSSVHPVSFRKK